MSNILFEDIFDVRQINPDGKKFEGGKICKQQMFSNKFLLKL